MCSFSISVFLGVVFTIKCSMTVQQATKQCVSHSSCCNMLPKLLDRSLHSGFSINFIWSHQSCWLWLLCVKCLIPCKVSSSLSQLAFMLVWSDIIMLRRCHRSVLWLHILSVGECVVFLGNVSVGTRTAIHDGLFIALGSHGCARMRLMNRAGHDTNCHIQDLFCALHIGQWILFF